MTDFPGDVIFQRWKKMATPVPVTPVSVAPVSGDSERAEHASASTAPEIFYPDCDGEPVANNMEQFEIIVLIKSNLDILFANDSNVLIAGDLFWYPIEGNNQVKCPGCVGGLGTV
jgi:hypothetical protein